jgi:3-keto-5-aminohexanoate cleavage enzyme
MDYDSLIINLAPTGIVHTRADSPHLPVSPDEIVADCCRGRDAGVSMVHIHARNAEGGAAFQKEIYGEIIAKVRAKCPDLILCASTSGRVFSSMEQRSEVLDLEDAVLPDMASLTLGSMNFPSSASVNEPDMIAGLLKKMRERGVIPELEVFDWGMVDYAKYLLRRGLLADPLYFNILLGSLGTLHATPFHLATLVHELPENATWAATGIGRSQLPVNAMAISMGGHVRVGLEDSAFLDTGKTRPASNLDLVERIVRIARAVGRPIASPNEARRMIGLPLRER